MGQPFASVVGAFFDSGKVMGQVEKKRRQALSRFGAFVRRKARSSIRKSKKSALPGQPPRSHKGQLKLIFFAYDSRRRDVVVGPIPFAAKGGSAIVPGLMERGGETTIVNRRGKSRTKKYRGNPFMRPALEAESPKFAGLFKGV